ncbi:2,3-epoxybenzoyl-CoA dihydrolase [Pseudomaricurvus alkylphenolicus]|uniref:2,3-epoxybenzoyl-CoA dihydrolase n=1 Tax=Pseudomaricurvus alkylphenolicus TaxID=1306991 RepID=UPI0014246FAA|nr:2,3-epoxybenzoyl-CoA dihydrolase [Pseudomaricurvus alkylphenolicus]NIB43471.1 2,3-epoxybenzoyl-CoA dihydrolase [Pseudomaricurvus alkylphenolicus]
MIDFQTSPDNYKHWKLSFDGSVATLTMDVDPSATLFDGYELKLNSYDLGVDIELYDAVQRLRFEHPEVKTVIMNSAKDKVFCAGANIRMLGGAAHAHKVNFCKFTNETRNSIEDASDNSQQRYLCAVSGTAAGGGYELALATDYIMMADDGNSAVSLPEVPLLAVLPGTGGLTRVVDKRKVRRDHADVFCTIEEGVRGQRAVDWRLVDEVVPGSKFNEAVLVRAQEIAATSDRPDNAKGITLPELQKDLQADSLTYDFVDVQIDRNNRVATVTVKASETANPAGMSVEEAESLGADFWPLAACRQLDDAILHLRFNEMEMGTLIFKTEGDADIVEAYDEFVNKNQNNWLMREIALYWRRTLKRVDLTSRTLLAFVEPGSCFVGVLAELLFAVDRCYMLEGQFENDSRPAPTVRLTASNFGPYPMSNGITRLQTRFLGEPESVDTCENAKGQRLDAKACEELGLTTYCLDFIDWDDETRVFLEERASFSPDCLTGMEANLRFAGPETMETKIFGRLTAWQNWIFQRPNAVAEKGALQLYGTGARPEYDLKRV